MTLTNISVTTKHQMGKVNRNVPNIRKKKKLMGKHNLGCRKYSGSGCNGKQMIFFYIISYKGHYQNTCTFSCSFFGDIKYFLSRFSLVV